MSDKDNLKLFISYSHLDEQHVKEFIKHIAPLKNNGLIEDWRDRKIIPGQDFLDTIDNNLETAEVICLFISASFLDSPACIKEKKKALELRKRKGIVVVPIILSACGWLDDKEISYLLALPTDAKAVSDFADHDTAWNDVYNGIKSIVVNIITIKKLKITEQFSNFLSSTELLSKAHSQKAEVFLEDIFVYPDVIKYDDLREYEKKESSENIILDFCEYSKILIAGENQSGKTSLCKILFIELRKQNFVPIYISDRTNQYQGIIENKILNAYKKQYETVPIEEIDRKRIVPIIDDFHFAKNKEKHIRDLSSYCYRIVVVDDIFNLNFKDENLIKSYTHFKIKEFSPSLRNQLIKKWTYLTDKINGFAHTENELYKNIDHTTELVNTTLGKIFNSGIMPAYPFFILSIISTYETFEKPLDQEITSQGYCYQAFIYMYLRKEGVKNDEIDTYVNFLTELAYYFFKEKKIELSIDDFQKYMNLYLEKYNLPIKGDILLKNLQNTKIISVDSFNNYSFGHQYLYYFFVAKYLAEHSASNKESIDLIIRNLHKNENAYIAIFISHHSKNNTILDEIINNASGLFSKYQPATLTKEELNFFDNELEGIVKAVLPPTNSSPERERAKELITQDMAEENNNDVKKEPINDSTEENNELSIELRRSIKTVEVMGTIIKNRAGSLEKIKLEKIFHEAMGVHLRLLTSFFVLIQNENEQGKVVDFISNRLNKIIQDLPRRPKQEKLEKLSKLIFWNMNFSIVYGYIDKIIHSLGSDKLITIVEKVCENEKTPASFLIKHGILMWYNKNLQVDNIANTIKEEQFSETAKRIMNFKIVNHCSMHHVGYKDLQKIENKLKIPSQRLLQKNAHGE